MNLSRHFSVDTSEQTVIEWAEEMWSSKKAKERLIYGLGMKILIEGGMALITYFSFYAIFRVSSQIISYPQFPFGVSNGFLQDMTVIALFAILFCSIVERN